MSRAIFFVAAVAALPAWAEDDPGSPFFVPGEPVHDSEAFAFFLGDRIEVQSREGAATFVWDTDAWIGDHYDKFWLKSEGEYNFEDGKLESGTLEPLYARTIAAYWTAQAGIRHEFIEDKDDRTFVSLGVQGLAPGFFEVDPTLLISTEGDVSLTAEAEYDQLLTQRLVLQPRVEVGFQFQDVPEYDLGEGFSDVEVGLRLRYEITRQFAPYVGVSYARSLGETADMIEESGGDTGTVSAVAGVRVWF